MSPDDAAAPFPIVGLGASAGGLAALEAFFRELGTGTGAAYVVVTHMHPDQVSLLPELLARATDMEVVELADGVALAPDHVYVPPRTAHVGLEAGHFHLSEPPRDDRRHPIDYFFRSLAAAAGERAVCVVLSGSGSDGALGLREVKEAFGLALAQDPETAEFDGMPRSAVGTGLVDAVRTPGELAGCLRDLLERAAVPAAAGQVLADQRPAVLRILDRLRLHTGHDFSAYKLSTVHRRLARRLIVHRLDDLGQYEQLVADTPGELDLLFRELLIGVTRFFRDTETFEALGRAVAERLRADAPGEDAPLRAWVAGCATGEEAYSVAITLLEVGEATGSRRPVQVFATDIDETAIATARAGVYPASISLDVSPERLRRYFASEEGAWRVRSDVRELVVFAVHSVVKDPPFNRLHLACCRNVLIYMDVELQRTILPALAYSLEPGGLLFLGKSEGIGPYTDLFEPDMQGHRIHRRRDSAMPLHHYPGVRAPRPPTSAASRPPVAARGETSSAIRRALEEITPAAVVVDPTGEIVYVSGHTGPFLELAPGHTTSNLFRLARPGLQHEAATLVRQAQNAGGEVTRDAVLEEEGGPRRVRLRVRPVGHADRRLFVVAFERLDEPPAPEGEAAPAATAGQDDDRDQDQLRRELTWTRENLQSTIEDLEASNEELSAANEELVSTNEELQSTNEELETSKEEMQSLNEELHSVNHELERANQDLVEANADLCNLLDATRIATLFLDRALRIKRFTDPMGRLFNLLATDIDRPIAHLTTRLRYDRLVADAEQVLDTLVPTELEVEDEDGRWYVMRMLPRRTDDDVIAGLVVTLSEITLQKAIQTRLQEAQRFTEAVTAAVPLTLAVLDTELRVVSVSQSFGALTGLAHPSLAGRRLAELPGFGWLDEAACRDLGQAVGADPEGPGVRVADAEGRAVLRARPIVTLPEAPRRLLLLVEGAAGAA